LMLEGMFHLPSASGSGQSGTPCDRMQSAYLIPWEDAFGAAVLAGGLEDPHAAVTVPASRAAASSRAGASERAPYG
jgi:hypothetical protein